MKSKSATAKRKSPSSVESLQQRIAKLRAERKRLRAELTAVSAERDQYSKAVGSLMAEKYPVAFDEDEVFAQLPNLQRTADLIAELKAKGDKPCRPRKSRRTR
jgi:uncharacterized small protein (DUF1192 family)